MAAGFRALEERKQEINDLNVYPVPDGDTGTNLSLTVKGMLEDLTPPAGRCSRAGQCRALISQAALMGARGNSGVILSQIVRGAMEVLGQDGPSLPGCGDPGAAPRHRDRLPGGPQAGGGHHADGAAGDGRGRRGLGVGRR